MKDYTLLLGDCLEILPTIETASVDAIFTDPPYPYIKREYGYWTEAEWMPMMQEVVKQGRRVLKPQGSMVMVLQPNSEKVGKMRLWLWRFMVWCGEEWNIVQDAYWWNTAALPTVHTHQINGLMRPSIKQVMWLGNENCYRNQAGVMWLASEQTIADKREGRALHYRPSGYSMRDGRSKQRAKEQGISTPFNVLPASNGEKRDGHGAGTPLALTDWWLRYISKPGDLVLDPFSGTATTGIAALKLGRRYIGIERMEKYHLAAHSRMAAEIAKAPLFAGVAA